MFFTKTIHLNLPFLSKISLRGFLHGLLCTRFKRLIFYDSFYFLSKQRIHTKCDNDLFNSQQSRHYIF